MSRVALRIVKSKDLSIIQLKHSIINANNIIATLVPAITRTLSNATARTEIEIDLKLISGCQVGSKCMQTRCTP